MLSLIKKAIIVVLANVILFADRYDHSPDDDHNDSITGLTSCPRLKLYASASIDGTIRIWNEQNELTR